MNVFEGLVRKVRAASVVWLAAGLVGLGALGFAMVQVHSATAEADHSDRVLLQATDLERKVVDLETGLRGYAITRDRVFLQPMLAAQKRIPDELDELESLAAGDVGQERRAEAITNAVWSYARYWLKPALRLPESDSALAAQMWASIGRERMELIRKRFAAFERAERADHASSTRSVALWEGIVAAIMVASLLALVAALALTVRRHRGGVAAEVEDLAAKLEESDARNDALLDELERQSKVDRLTGIANRDSFMERLESECVASRRHCGDFSVLLLDIDGLVRINAEHGYAAGNAVLLRIVGLLNAQLRSGDVIARVGGDEFGILLPRTPAPGAEVVMAGLRGAISSEPITAGTAEIPVQVSIGAASAAHDAEPGQLLQSAELDMAARRAPDAGLEQEAA